MLGAILLPFWIGLVYYHHRAWILLLLWIALCVYLLSGTIQQSMDTAEQLSRIKVTAAYSDQCPINRPIAVTVHNKSDRQVASVDFVLVGAKRGSTQRAYADVRKITKITEPGTDGVNCMTIPQRFLGDYVSPNQAKWVVVNNDFSDKPVIHLGE